MRGMTEPDHREADFGQAALACLGEAHGITVQTVQTSQRRLPEISFAVVGFRHAPHYSKHASQLHIPVNLVRKLRSGVFDSLGFQEPIFCDPSPAEFADSLSVLRTALRMQGG